ncbi:MAG TPA: TetR/AcrR family transcriptional regulator [Thermoleophilaceae bacterium]
MATRAGTSSRGEHQLPPGPHGLSRSFVARNQRERILAAVADATSEAGYGSTSVEDVIARAGVSRRTFYDLFDNKLDAFLAAYDEVVRRLLKGVREADADQTDFAARVTAGLGAFLDSLSASPAFARMCIVEVLAAGPEAVRRRNDAMAAFRSIIEEEADRLLDRKPHSPVAVEMLVGGIYETVYSRIADGRTTDLGDLLPELVYAAVLPHLGEDAAVAARRSVLESAAIGRSSHVTS